MPDSCDGVTDEEVIRELYHQTPSAILAHNIDPRMMTKAPGVYFAGRCLWTTVAFS
jgi:hypothetical protein